MEYRSSKEASQSLNALAGTRRAEKGHERSSFFPHGYSTINLRASWTN
ncbi:MAG: hypothetical protein GKR87_16035 [Kiritimatiellae bacterium]|nr:hypothetical protein [Kiritimatiellia bacterium]